MTRRPRNRPGNAVTLAILLLGAAGCDTVEPEPQIRFSPSALNVEVGSTVNFSGIVTLGVPSGTWFVQPNSHTAAEIEITGPMTASFTCLGQGAGTFVLSTLTTQGQASGSLYYICYL